MKRSEMLALFQYLKSYYNKKFEIPGREKKQDMMVNTWLDFLGEYPYPLVKHATKRLMTREEWSPTPGQILQEINNLQEDEEDRITAEEAWYKVKEAISTIGYTYNPQKVKEALPDKALRAAQVIGLSLIAREGDKNSYLMNSYIKAYNNLEEKRKEQQRLPKSLRKETERLAGKFKGTPQIEVEIKGGGSDE